jgi:antitoxin component YwqK of YwqJK toxin-antitoxin module
MRTYLILLVTVCLIISCNSDRSLLNEDFKVSFSENGDTTSIEIFNRHGEFIGLILFDSLGFRSNMAVIRDGVKVDSITYFTRQGTIESILYLNDTCEINHCCCDGVQVDFDSSGQIVRKFERINDIPYGYVYWYLNGQLLIKSFEVDGVKQGNHYVYHTNGSLKIKRTYKNGILNGPEYSYNQDGSIKYVTTFRNDLQNGYCVEFYDNYIIEGYYRNDLEEGIWTQHNLDSDTLITRVYKKGIILSQKESMARFH